MYSNVILAHYCKINLHKYITGQNKILQDVMPDVFSFNYQNSPPTF